MSFSCLNVSSLLLPFFCSDADAHLDNFLAESEAVTAIIDFEFSSRDWRVMEIAGEANAFFFNMGDSHFVSVSCFDQIRGH